MNNAQQIDRELYKIDNKGRPYTTDKDYIISLIFRCDMCTAQCIVNRIGEELQIGSDSIVVLKTADCLIIAKHAYDILTGKRPITEDEIKTAQTQGI